MANSIEIGYCTNVHAGTSLERIKLNLEKHSLAVKQQFSPHHPMGIGLWVPNQAATELVSNTNQVEQFKDWLRERGLRPFTFNAFPFSDFHRETVKHDVYLPTWASTERMEYTKAIANIHSRLLDDGELGTISTLPLSWPDDLSNEFFRQCSNHLIESAKSLATIHEQTGRHIFLCIEPEPGCTLGSGKSLAEFFEQHLLSKNTSKNFDVREYIGVCHDVCHCAVMFDDQQHDLRRYQELGIRIGKYQISSAVEVNFNDQSVEEKQKLVQALSFFAEDRYLHQTCVQMPTDGTIRFFEDLPIALRSMGDAPIGIWRIHFHVPIFADRVGMLDTTSHCINDLMRSVKKDSVMGPVHFEVETYAWTVLPDVLQPSSLANGIASELKYFSEHCLPMLAKG